MSSEEMAELGHILRALCEQEQKTAGADASLPGLNNVSLGAGTGGVGHNPCDNLTAYVNMMSNDYYDYTDSAVDVPPENIVLPVIFGTTLICGLVGNSLVVYVVVRDGAMKTITNMYFANLAVADLCFLLFCVPFTTASYVLPSWPFGQNWCKFVNYFTIVSMGTSVMTLATMSLDRYQAVVRPIQSRNSRTIRRTMVILVLVWMFNILSSIPMLFLSRLTSFWEQGAEKVYCADYFHTPAIRRAFTLTLFIIFYLVPLTVIAICYFMMTLSLKDQGRPGTDKTNRASEANRNRKKKIAKLVLVVVATFALCWLPIHVVHLRNDFGSSEYSNVFYIIKILSHCLSYANSAINPIIYSFMSKSFRSSFKEACCCKTGSVVSSQDEPEAKKIVSSNTSQPGTQSAENGGSSGVHFKEENSSLNLDPAGIQLITCNRSNSHDNGALSEEVNEHAL